MTREQAIKEIYGIPANKKQHEALQILIPELKENEGERVRKALIDLVCTVGEYYLKPDSRNRMLAWLDKEKEWDELQAEFRSINEAFENGKKEVVDNPEKYGLCRHEEWSEKDEEIFNNIVEKAKGGYWIEVNEITWLITRFKSFRSQPKQECSEEDEKDMAHIIRILDDCYAYGKHDLSKTDHENLVGALKSLRPQPKLEWSEEDEHRRDGIIHWLREYQWQFNPKYDSISIESIESLIDWLKSLRPSWKPTEEQMGALDYAYGELFKRGDVGHNILGPLQKLCDECRRRIKELSKQIKKS